MGRPTVDRPSFLIVGDSIASDKNDSGISLYGIGLFQRGMRDADFTNPRPDLNFAISSSRYSAIGGTLWTAYCQFAKYGIGEYGINDVGASATVPSIEAAALQCWSRMKANGIQKVIRSHYLPQTTSTDNWATLGGQTQIAAQQPGGAVRQLNDWFDSKLADGTVDYLVTFPSLRDPSDPYYWRTDGSIPFYTAADQTHPSPSGSEIGAADLRALIATLP